MFGAVGNENAIAFMIGYGAAFEFKFYCPFNDIAGMPVLTPVQGNLF
jgi:hypothetical protein